MLRSLGWGRRGVAGRGVASASVNASGQLVLTLTDGTTANAGLVRGGDGRGVQSATVNPQGRLILTLTDGSTVDTGYVIGSAGATPTITIGTITTLAAGAPATATITGTTPNLTLNLGIPQGATGTPATTLLGTVTIAETSLVTLSAGVRRVTVATPAAWGIVAGQDIIVSAVSEPAGYALHDAVVTGANQIAVNLTVPVISVLGSYSITARVRRFT